MPMPLHGLRSTTLKKMMGPTTSLERFVMKFDRTFISQQLVLCKELKLLRMRKGKDSKRSDMKDDNDIMRRIKATFHAHGRKMTRL